MGRDKERDNLKPMYDLLEPYGVIEGDDHSVVHEKLSETLIKLGVSLKTFQSIMNKINTIFTTSKPKTRHSKLWFNIVGIVLSVALLTASLWYYINDQRDSEIDVFEYVSVSYEGEATGYGSAYYELDLPLDLDKDLKTLYDSISFEFTDNQKLFNGSEVALTAKVDPELLESQKLFLTKESKNYVVSGLPEATKLDNINTEIVQNAVTQVTSVFNTLHSNERNEVANTDSSAKEVQYTKDVFVYYTDNPLVPDNLREGFSFVDSLVGGSLFFCTPEIEVNTQDVKQGSVVCSLCTGLTSTSDKESSSNGYFVTDSKDESKIALARYHSPIQTHNTLDEVLVEFEEASNLIKTTSSNSSVSNAETLTLTYERILPDSFYEDFIRFMSVAGYGAFDNMEYWGETFFFEYLVNQSPYYPNGFDTFRVDGSYLIPLKDLEKVYKEHLNRDLNPLTDLRTLEDLDSLGWFGYDVSKKAFVTDHIGGIGGVLLDYSIKIETIEPSLVRTTISFPNGDSHELLIRERNGTFVFISYN